MGYRLASPKILLFFLCLVLSGYGVNGQGTKSSCDHSTEGIGLHQIGTVQAASPGACMNHCRSNNAPFYSQKINEFDCFCCSTLSLSDTMRTGGATTTSTRNCESWCTSVSEGDPCISDDCNGCPECNHACVAPTTTGYDVTETSLTMDTFDVTALCATGYEGSVTVAKCDAHGQAYRLSGCTAKPAGFDGYKFVGIGHCADSDGSLLDVHYQLDSSTMNPSRCAEICDEQPLCKGMGLDSADDSYCEIWVADGEGPIQGIDAAFQWYDGYSGSEIHRVDGTGTYECFKKNDWTYEPTGPICLSNTTDAFYDDGWCNDHCQETGVFFQTHGLYGEQCLTPETKCCSKCDLHCKDCDGNCPEQNDDSTTTCGQETLQEAQKWRALVESLSESLGHLGRRNLKNVNDVFEVLLDTMHTGEILNVKY